MINEKLFVAVDTNDYNRAKQIVGECNNKVYGVKFGLEFYVRFGLEAIERLMHHTNLQLFLDLKLHDIPNTVVGALDSIKSLKPKFVTVHGSGGQEMLRAVAQKVAGTETNILAVSLLTSLDSNDLAKMGCHLTAQEFVMNIARIAHETGIHGIVCSADEVSAVSQEFPSLVRMVPGIRPVFYKTASDQKRTSTPLEAILKGASYIVIGRAITNSPSISKTLQMINDE